MCKIEQMFTLEFIKIISTTDVHFSFWKVLRDPQAQEQNPRMLCGLKKIQCVQYYNSLYWIIILTVGRRCLCLSEDNMDS